MLAWISCYFGLHWRQTRVVRVFDNRAFCASWTKSQERHATKTTPNESITRYRGSLVQNLKNNGLMILLTRFQTSTYVNTDTEGTIESFRIDEVSV